MAEKSDTIASLLAEGRTFPPPPDFTAQARICHRRRLRRGRGRPRGVLGGAGRRAPRLVRAVAHRARVGPARSPSGSSAGSSTPPTTASTATSPPAAATRSPTTGRASPATPAPSPTPTSSRDVSQLANALKALGVQKGDRVNIYLGMVPELPMALLALRAHRRRALGGVRRLLVRLAARPHPGRRAPRCSSPATARGGAAASSPLKETADTAVAECPTDREGARAAPHRAGRRHGRRPRRVVARPRAPAVGRVRARADGQRGPPLPPLHQRHHGAAQGHHAHDRRLPHAGRVDAPERVRPASPTPTCTGARPTSAGSPATRYIVYGPLMNGCHRRALRGHARSPGQGPALGHRRALRRHHPLHRAHRDPHVHEVGGRVPREPRPLVVAAARHAWASPSTPRRGSGTGRTSVAAGARSSTPGGRPRPAPS